MNEKQIDFKAFDAHVLVKSSDFVTAPCSPLLPALHMACIGQHAEAARTLLHLGLQDSEDACGTTARQLAKKPGVVQVFESGLQDAS